MDAATLAELHGVSPRSVRTWSRQGLPVAQPRHGVVGALYDPRLAAEWIARRGVEQGGAAEASAGRLDALSRRTARQLRGLLAEHVPADDHRASHQALARMAHDRVLAAVPGLVAAVLPARAGGAASVQVAIEAGLRDTLLLLAGEFDALYAEALSARHWPPVVPAPKRSATLAAAREQLDLLRAELIDVQELALEARPAGGGVV